MWFASLIGARKAGTVPLFLYNTLTKTKERFMLPPHARYVRMYNCGPTVYDVQHIGNLSMYVFTDVLRRALEYSGFEVKQTINFTDVGHLAGDNEGNADEGEDRMTKALMREKLPLTLESMRSLGERYAAIFLENLRDLNIDTERINFPRASDHIELDIAMVQTLEEKGYAYRGKAGVYFDTSKFSDYGKLGDVRLEGLQAGARVALHPDKRSAADFLLWKFSSREGSSSRGDALGWDSPWGKGFPGWHIECSAMIRATLGQQIDIHTGGIEHIAVHHNNEIAQSESASGKKPLSRFWMHRSHLQINGSKISKSEGNTVYLSDIVERGFHPIALRYLFLGAHYRTPNNFTWEALEAASNALIHLSSHTAAEEGGSVPEAYRARFHERINDDLDTPGALAVLWDMTKDASLSPADRRAGLMDADRVLGLSLTSLRLRRAVSQDELPAALRQLYEEREAARERKDFQTSDIIRKQFASQGYILRDTPAGTLIERA